MKRNGALVDYNSGSEEENVGESKVGPVPSTQRGSSLPEAKLKLDGLSTKNRYAYFQSHIV